MICRVDLSFAVLGLVARVQPAGQEACLAVVLAVTRSGSAARSKENMTSSLIWQMVNLALQRSSHG